MYFVPARTLARLLTLGLVLFLAFGSLVTQPSVAHANNPVRFGIDEGYAAPDAFKQSGATWDRIDIHWDAIQPTGPNDWQPNDGAKDPDIARDLAYGMQVVGVVTNPPAWATRNGSTPANLSAPIDAPNNYWAAFMHRLAGQYAGRIDTWIIWNEPDIKPGEPGSSWGGTEDEFYTLIKTAKLAGREANPNVKIVFAGTTYWSDVLNGRKLFLDRVLDRATHDPDGASNGYFFDAVDIHIYSSPYQILSLTGAYREVLARYGLSKPIWTSELNVVPWNDPASTVPRGGFRATLDEQAAYVIEAVAMAEVAGVDHAAIYKMSDGTIIKGEPFGLVRNDGSWRPAFRAFQVAMQYVNSYGPASVASQGAADVVTIDGGKHKVTVAWSTKPTAADLSLDPTGTTSTLVDKAGQVLGSGLPRDPSQPRYVFRLTAATANTDDANPNDYIVGGSPVVLVEDGVGDGVMLDPGTLYYPVTGYAIAGPYLDYFEHRGGLRTFGYPISRPFSLQGSQVQFFQRRVLQLQPNGTMGQLNLLDPEYMPYTQINNASFPPDDPGLTQGLPSPGSPNYANQILQYIQSTTPNQWQGLPVNFGAAYVSTVSLHDAFPTGRPNAALLPGIDLELWGLPTSLPSADPNNHNFVYQRFQRGIMQFDASTGATQALLLGDYFKSIIIGANLPADLSQEAQASPFYKQYAPGQPGWVARPDQLPNTVLAFAFERQAAVP
jgi:hypothetical protein